MDDDDSEENTSREGARAVVKTNKKAKVGALSIAPTIEKSNARANIAEQMMATHTRMAKLKLIMQYGSAEQKTRILDEFMKELEPPPSTK